MKFQDCFLIIYIFPFSWFVLDWTFVFTGYQTALDLETEGVLKK